MRRVGLRRPRLRRASPARRLHASLLCVGFALSLIAGRLVQLQGLEGAAFSKQAANYKLQVIRIPAERGSITTADGTILAMTVQEDTVIADPPQIAGNTPRATTAVRQRMAALLAGPLHMTRAAILGKLYHPSSTDYVVLAQGVPVLVGNRIQAMLTARHLAGIYLRPTYVRSYPGKDLAAGLVGFTTTNITSTARDLVGQAGIEQSFNSLLAGRDGQEQVETGITGQPIPFASQKVRPVVPGGDVRLTILASLQWEAQQACAERVRVTHADNCTIVVEQPSTGRILAMAQYPTFEHGHVTSLASTVDLPVAGIFPPGSTAKVITAAAALEHGETPATSYTVPEQISVGGFSFHDAEWHPTERLTLAGIVAHSSNVGMVQVAQHVSPQVQYDYYRNFGVGVPTGLPLPNASAGAAPAAVEVVGGRAVHPGVRPGRRGHRRADGRRVRDHRQPRGPGVAEHRGGHHRAQRAVHPGAAAAPPAGDPALDGRRAHPASCSRFLTSMPQSPTSPGARSPGIRWRPRPVRPRSGTRRRAACASTARATSAWRRPATPSSWWR